MSSPRGIRAVDVRHGPGYDLESVRPLVEDKLAAMGTSWGEWTASMKSGTAAPLAARRVVIRELTRIHKWSAYRVAVALDVDHATVRRAMVDVHPKRKPGGHRSLAVVASEPTGPAMAATAGARLDCVHDGECLRAMLKRHPRHAPPEHASCPVRCAWQQVPDREAAMYVAGRAEMWEARR